MHTQPVSVEWCGAILVHFSENALSRETEKFITGNYTSHKHLRTRIHTSYGAIISMITLTFSKSRYYKL